MHTIATSGLPTFVNRATTHNDSYKRNAPLCTRLGRYQTNASPIDRIRPSERLLWRVYLNRCSMRGFTLGPILMYKPSVCHPSSLQAKSAFLSKEASRPSQNVVPQSNPHSPLSSTLLLIHPPINSSPTTHPLRPPSPIPTPPPLRNNHPLAHLPPHKSLLRRPPHPRLRPQPLPHRRLRNSRPSPRNAPIHHPPIQRQVLLRPAGRGDLDRE